MPEVTFEEAAGASSGIAPAGSPPLPAAKPARAPAPKSAISFEEATGGFVGTKPPEASAAHQAIGLAKQAGGEVAAVADFLSNLLVSFPLQVGGELGGTVGSMAVGDKRPYARGQEIGRKLSEPFANPAQKLLGMLDSGEIYEQAKTTKGLTLLSEKIKEAGKWVERKTQGKIQSEAVEMFVDTAMLGAGGKGVDAAAKLRAEALKRPSGIEQRATYQEGPNVDTKPRFKWTPAGPEAVAELQQIAKSGADREAALHEEVTQPPKPRLQGPPAVSREVETKIKELDGKAGGKADPEILPWLVAASGGALAAQMIYDEHQRSGRSVWEILKDPRGPAAQPREVPEGEPEPTPDGTFLAGAKELAPLALLAGAIKAKTAKVTKLESGAVQFSLTPAERAFFEEIHKSPAGKAEFLAEVPEAKLEGDKLTVPNEAAVAKLQDYADRTVTAAKGGGEKKLPPSLYESEFASIAHKEVGSADSRTLAKIAAVGTGALLGAQASQDPWLGGIAGAFAGGALARFGPSVGRAVMDATAATLKGEPMKGLKELVPGPITRALKEDTRIRIKGEMDAAEAFARREELRRNRLVNDTVEAIPEQTRREALAHWLEGNRAFTLSSVEQRIAGQIRAWFDRIGKLAQQAGVVKDLLVDYVTHIYGKAALPFLEQMMAARTTGATTSPFAKPRVGPPTIAEVNAYMLSKGKQPIVSDIAQIIEAYGNSMTKAVANKLLIDSLKKRTASFEVNGKRVEHPLVAPSFKAPGNYVNFGKGGLVAHPDIAPALRFAIDADNPILLMRGVEAVNTAIKRSAVSFSLFHAKALVDAFTGAAHLGKKGMALGAAAGLGVGVLNNDPITYALIGAGIGMAAKPLKLVGQAAFPKAFGENRFVRALRKEDPALAKMIDLSFEGGLMYSLRKGPLAVEEVGNTFYQGMEWAQKSLDAIIPGGGMAVKGLEKLNHAVDGFMWERLHTAMKLEIFAQKYEVLLQNNAKAHVADPRVKLFSEKEIAERAASFTNDIFGGLNWRRIAEETRTRWGRDLAMGVYSPAGRRVMRLAMFAPDWTISTTRAAIKAFGPLVGQEAGGGLKGLVSPRTLTDLHRQYMLRSAFYYLMVGDGLNYALNGKHLWQEDDPTYIHMKDGRRIQYSKHTMEPYHWLQHPIQQGINKMGQVPREIINQMLGTEYLNPKVGKTGQVFAGPKMEGSRLGHAARTVSPIGVQQLSGGGAAAGAMGALGMPVYGKTKAEIARLKEERKRKKRLEGK